jgi:diguanylate cyclase (GGDEF)-like protein
MNDMTRFGWIISFWIIAFSTASNANEHVVLQLKWVNQFQFAGYYAALDKGYYSAAGLDVELRSNGYNGNFKSPINEVLSGNAQYGISNSGLVLDFLNGKPVIALAATLQHSAVSWLVLKRSGITGIHDMVNKRLMTVFPLSESTELLEPFVAEGIDIKKLNLIQTGFDLKPLINGEVDAYDAYVTNEPFILEQLGISYRLIDPRSYGIDFYGDVLFTSAQELEQNPKRVEAFRKASMQGWNYAMAHPDEIIDLIIRKYAPQKSIEHLRYEARKMTTLMQPEFIELGHMNPERWMRIADIMTQHKQIINENTLVPFIYNQRNYQSVLMRYSRIIVIVSLLALALAGITTWIYQTNRRLSKEIEARKIAEDKLRLLSETDGLTNLANRRSFKQSLDSEFQRFQKNQSPYCVIMIDIDWFKLINDTHGHSAGDQILVEFATRLHNNVGPNTATARVGGEEFALIINDTSLPEAHQTIKQLQYLICQPFLIDCNSNNIETIVVTASFGISTVLDSDLRADDAMRRADDALYKAKHNGRNQIAVYNDRSSYSIDEEVVHAELL